MISEELIDVIGEQSTIELAEAFAGTRLYVPPSVSDDHAIALAIGPSAADAFCKFYSSGTVRVPLLRELRAKHYRAIGLSNARIAVRLGLTETGVEKLFQRLKRGSET